MCSICNFPSRLSPPIMTAARRLFPNFEMAGLAATPDGVRLGGIQLLSPATAVNFEQDDNGNAPGEVAEQFSQQTAVPKKVCSSATSYDFGKESASPTLTPRSVGPLLNPFICQCWTGNTLQELELSDTPLFHIMPRRPMSPAPSLAACLRYTFSSMVPKATQLGTPRRHGSKPTHMHIGCLLTARRKAPVMISFIDIYAKITQCGDSLS